MSLLAIDMGSSSCKAVVYAVDGRILAETSLAYTSNAALPARTELPAEVFWQTFREVTCHLSQATVSDPIEAIGISSHGETFTPVDDRNQPIAPAILNMDNRAGVQTQLLKRRFDPKRVFEITGLTIHPMYPLPKVLWLREHQADVFARTRRLLPVTSYLLARLGAEPCVDYSLACRFLAFDVRKKEWSGEILEPCGLDAGLFPRAVPAGTIAGELASKLAEELGLPGGTPIVVGGHDQPCAALGMGAIEPGRVSASLGTYECLLASSKEPAVHEDAFAANLNTYCHVVPDRYVTLAYFPAGIMLEWFLGLFRDVENGKDYTIDRACSAWESRASCSPGRLLICPHLLGTCNPDFDPRASGVIVGLRPATRASDIYQGIQEGIACEFAAMTKLLQRVAGNFQDVYVTGGGCRSMLGMKLRAALSGCNLFRTSSSDAVCLGTAILAGFGAGKYKSIPQSLKQCVRVTDTQRPDPNVAAAYRDYMRKYQVLYSSLANLRASASTGDL